jgi:E3 ubiquitin-protein ligase UHRF1
MNRPWVSGIASGPNGAYSIALSGGYDDDVDEGYAL